MTRVLRLRARGATDGEIAAKLGIDAKTLSIWLIRNGGQRPTNLGRPVVAGTLHKRARICAMYRDGVPAASIAKRLDMTKQSVHWHLRRAGVVKKYTAADDAAILLAIAKLAKKLDRPPRHVASRIGTLAKSWTRRT